MNRNPASMGELIGELRDSAPVTQRLFFCRECPPERRAPLPQGRSICEPCANAQAMAWKREQLVAAIESVPVRYREAKFEAVGGWVKDDAAIMFAHGAAKDQDNRVVLLGPPGAGKTSLAACIFHYDLDWAVGRGDGLKHFADMRKSRFVSAVTLSTSRSVSALGEEASLVRQAMVAPLLILDDLGQEKATPRDPIVEVLFYRFDHRQRTVVTTGLTVGQVSQRYGGGIERRLFEGASVIQVKP